MQKHDNQHQNQSLFHDYLLLHFVVLYGVRIELRIPPFLPSSLHSHQAGYDGCQSGQCQYKGNAENIDDHIRRHRLPDIGHGNLRRRNPFHHKEGHAKGRSDQTCFQGDEHEDAEPDGVITEGINDGHEDGYGDHHDRHGFHEATQDEDDDQHADDDHDRAVCSGR